jgi:predicted dehydrogenase
MATTWGDARLMAQEADRRDVQLTFNHQRRMASPGRDVNDLLAEGAIGELRRIELACGELLDNGTHYIDLAIEHVVDRLDGGEEPELSARRALDSTAVIFGAYESRGGAAAWSFPSRSTTTRWRPWSSPAR